MFCYVSSACFALSENQIDITPHGEWLTTPDAWVFAVDVRYQTRVVHKLFSACPAPIFSFEMHL